MKESDKQSNTTESVIATNSLHTACKTLLLHAFIQAYCNNDLSGLIISGPLNDSELQVAWGQIQLEYCSIIKNQDSDYLFDLAKQIALLQWHVDFVQNAVAFLRERYAEDIAGELASLGYVITDSIETDPEGYERQLNMILSLCKSQIFELESLNDEYTRFQNPGTGKKQSEEDFVKTVLILSKYQGYRIDQKITTVLEFVIIFNNYLAEMNAKLKQLNNGRGQD